MFIDKNEYQESKQKEREELNNNPCFRNKVKGALLCGMMVASIALTGCGNDIQVEESTQVSQEIQNEEEGELFYFFNGIDKEPIEVNVIVERSYNGTANIHPYRIYLTSDNECYKFSATGCELYKDIIIDDIAPGGVVHGKAVATFTTASMIKIDYYKEVEKSNSSLNYLENIENINENNLELEK